MIGKLYKRRRFKMKTKRFSLSLLIVIAVMSSFVFFSSFVFAGGIIKIGASLSMTGKYARTGQYTKNGYKLWMDEINAKGGLLGKKVKFIIYDDQSDPKKGAKLYEKLITSDKVDLLMGPYSSAVTFAASTVTEKYKFPMVTAGSTSEEIWKRGYKYVFGTGPHNELYYVGAFEIAKKIGLKTIGIINADDLFPTSLANAVRGVAKKNGIKVIFEEEFPKGAQDFTPLITKLKSVKPDFLFGGTYLPDSVLIVRQMKELNYCPKMLVLSVAPSMPDFKKSLGANADYVMGESFWEPTLNTPGNNEFIEAYKKKYGSDPEYHGPWAYSGCMVLAAAVKKAGSLDKEKIRAALSTLKLQTLLPGPYKVDSNGMQIGNKALVVQIINGKREVVWPEKYATKKAILPIPAWNKRK